MKVMGHLWDVWGIAPGIGTKSGLSRDQVLSPLLADDLLEMTNPHKPKSRLQKYRISDKGRAWLADETKGGSR